MAQTQRNPTSMTWTNLASQAATITTLRANIAQGKDIRAVDINSLATLINNCLGHYHTYSDSYQLATYGNNGDRTNYSETKASAATGITAAVAVVANTDITFGKHNSLRDAVNSLRTHAHSISDRISI
jgi:hypothetical protein